MKELFWTESAQQALAEHIAYLAQRDPDAAQRVRDAVVAAVEHLEFLPFRGRPGRRPDTRELIINPYPYIVVYEVLGERVNILRVWHSAQNWQSRMEDDSE
ncbi:MAG: type II toxin-antitoxin system RelE/ParE family toxin [Chloroflexaceae bacterium]|jgi:toxin ParE1/3/4|nr:type II toxin-antitoxin system RelE/ParE family toxin [Chloroflexaceae bacterium]